MNSSVYEMIKRYVPSKDIFVSEPLSEHTTFRVGGVCDCLVQIGSMEQLEKLIPFFKETEQDYFLLGNGSNLLVSDQGYRGIVLSMAGEMSNFSLKNDRIRAQSGISLIKLAREAGKAGLSGLEFASGIPGSLGGALIMNAGAYDGEMKLVTQDVTVLSPTGEVMTLS